MNQSSKHVSSDGETPQSVDRSLLEFLKPKSEERYSKLEAYCDLLSRASAGAYATPEAEGALQLLPGQFVATISELSRQWKWQRATVRQFIAGLANLGHISTKPYSKSFIFSVNLSQRLSLFVHQTIFSTSAPCSLFAISKAGQEQRKWQSLTTVIIP